MTQGRDKIICLINEVRSNGARQKHYNVGRNLEKGDGRLSPKHSPINKLKVRSNASVLLISASSPNMPIYQ